MSSPFDRRGLRGNRHPFTRLPRHVLGVLVGGALAVLAAGGSLAGGVPDSPLVSTGGGGATAIPPHSERSDCISCHRFKPSLSHPVGMTPAMTIPSGFPLRDGKMACVTCHEVGGSDSGGAPGALVRPQLRGGREGAAFCMQCHGGSTTDRPAAHGQGIPFAHLPAAGEQRGEAAFGLDLESHACMTCHDGTMAGDAGWHAGKAGRSPAERDHPVGVKYRERPASGESEEVRLVSEKALDPRVRLFNSAVGCGSCHSVYSKTESLLVVSNQRSQLCLKCHNQ